MESDELEIHDFYTGKKIIFLVATYYIVLCKDLNIYYTWLCHFENISSLLIMKNNGCIFLQYFMNVFEYFVLTKFIPNYSTYMFP